MACKLAIAALIVCALAIAILAIVWTFSQRVVVSLPCGQTLTLIDVSYGTNIQNTPVSNPFDRSWRKLSRALFGRTITGQEQWVKPPEGTAIFWFWNEQKPNVDSNVGWIAVVQTTNSSKPLSGIAGQIGVNGSPEIVGIGCQHFPTNKQTLLLSFYKSVPVRRFGASDLNESNILTQISLLNPFYRK